MKKLMVSFVVFSSLFHLACEKDGNNKNISACALSMKQKFEKELKCSEKGTMESNLYVGIYNNQKVYFVDIMCPSCSTAAPQFGYTCDDKKVMFEDFSKMKDVKQVYNSCTKEFME